MKHRVLFALLAILGTGIFLCGCQSGEDKGSGTTHSYYNFIVVFADDLGYGDLSCYGHPTIHTPNLDKMAAEGQRWTNFYAAANVCSPSRAALLTGRLPVRNGMATNRRRVFFPDSDGGLPVSEITIAEVLKSKGYQTACIGKWHLGHLPEYLPTNQGFDYYFGLPFSNDMAPTTDMGHYNACMDPKSEYFNVPLMRNDSIIEQPANQTTLTKRYTAEAVQFIQQNKNDPFFLYLPHSMPHVPLFASKDFENTSLRGLFGDVVEEIDWSMGQIMETLKKEGLDENTLVVFTSDNGPWVVLNSHGGSAGLLYGAKATSYEGGVREPAIFWLPGLVNPGVIHQMGSTLDLLPTIANLAGAGIPEDRVYDGYDLSPVLAGSAESPRNEFIYYHGRRIFAARKGDYKLVFYENNPKGYPEKLRELDEPRLFNLMHDPEERFDISSENPEISVEIESMVESHKSTVVQTESELDKIVQK